MKNPLYFLGKPIADKFRESVSGDKNGMARWVAKIAEDGDIGFYGPGSAVWEVHSSLSTIYGGICALILQTAHPAALAGVRAHSRYQSDLFGRLIGTTEWITITTFGSTKNIEDEARRVNAMHQKVVGEYENKNGEMEKYRADMEKFLAWVHIAFTLSFWESYKLFNSKINTTADEYIKGWAKSAIPLGLSDAPESASELQSKCQQYLKNDLVYNEKTKEVIDFILNPPFPFLTGLVYKAMAKGALCAIPDQFLTLLQLKKPRRIWVKLNKALLYVMNIGLAGESPAKLAAVARIERARII